MFLNVDRVRHGEVDCAVDEHEMPALATFAVSGMPMCVAHFMLLLEITEVVT